LFVPGVIVGDLRSDAGLQPAAQGQFTPAPYSAGSPTTYSAPPAALPTPEEFTIGVKILKKQCFRSAGCSIGYQIDPKYTGVWSLPKDTFTGIYEVPLVKMGRRSITIVSEDGTVSFRKERRISTASFGATLMAKATSVSH
jgi:hypothetical protein